MWLDLHANKGRMQPLVLHHISYLANKHAEGRKIPLHVFNHGCGEGRGQMNSGICRARLQILDAAGAARKHGQDATLKVGCKVAHVRALRRRKRQNLRRTNSNCSSHSRVLQTPDAHYRS